MKIIRTLGLLASLCITSAASAGGELKKSDYGYGNIVAGISIGVMSGEANELVLNPDGSKLSHLIWDFDNNVMLKGHASAGITDRFSIGGSLAIALTDDSYMEDYDWLYVGAPWSHRSQHSDTTLDEATKLDLYVSGSLIKNQNYRINALLGYKYDKYEWSARGGNFVYSNPGYFRDISGSFIDGLPVIAYSQEWSMPYIGISAKAEYDRFSISGKVIGSWWVSLNENDDHWLRDLNIKGDYNDGTMIATEIEASYKVTPDFSIFANYGYEKLEGGETTRTYTDPIAQYTAPGDADLESHTIYAGVKYTY